MSTSITSAMRNNRVPCPFSKPRRPTVVSLLILLFEYTELMIINSKSEFLFDLENSIPSEYLLPKLELTFQVISRFDDIVRYGEREMRL